jgi:hypothetical protein
MGVVYRARDPRIDRVVAIKTVSFVGQDPREEQDYRDHFAQEARAAGRLSHPGIVTVFDAGEDPATLEPYFVMEFVAGQPLSRMLEATSGRLPLSTALGLTCEIADALHYAHSEGVIHGDIKPSNILVTADGHTKIADFGVARLSRTLATHAGKVFGSPAYMAPEQLCGGRADARSDLFSLGVMLYSMLTGFRPFQGNSAQTVCFKVMNIEPVPVSSLQAELPPELDRIVLRAIAKDAGQRYQTGAELAADTRALLSNDSSLDDATRFFTRVLQQDGSAARQEHRRATLSRRFQWQAAVALIAVAWLLTAFKLGEGFRQAAAITPPPAALPAGPPVLKPVMKPLVEPAVPRAFSKRANPRTAKVRVEILHHFASGKASVWIDQQLVLEQDLRSDADRRLLFRALEMNQVATLQFASGKHKLQVRITAPANTYDQSETVEANLTAGPEHVLYVNCDRRKMLVRLQ